MPWTLEYSGTEKTIEDWGLRNLILKRVSQQPDEFTCDADGRAYDLAALFGYLDTITVRRDRTKNSNGTFSGGSTFFVGRRILDPRSATGRAESNHFIFQGPWWYLENLVYQQNWKVNQAPPGGALVGQPRSHVFLNQDDNGAVRDTAWQINDAAAFAIAAGAPMSIDGSLPAFNIPIDEQRDVTCAEVIRKQLRWIPDAVTWFDYAQSPPRLSVKQRGSLTVKSLSVAGAGIVTSVDITRRDDLSRPAVVLKFEQVNEINGVAWLTATEQKHPGGATGQEFGAFLATIQLQGFSMQMVSTQLSTAAVEADHATDATRLNWWKDRLPKLKNTRIKNLAIPVSGVVRETARPRELTAGQVAPWQAFAVGTELIKAKATYQLEDENTPANIIAERKEEELTVRINTTDATTGTFHSVASFVSGESVPSGLATALYNAINLVQYDGQIITEENEITGSVLIGDVLNLTGGLAAWATMNALVQQVIEDLDHGRTTIIVGPAGHLGPEDIVELLRVNRFRWNYTSPAARTSGVGPSGAVALGKETPKENSDSGSDVHKRLVIIDGASGQEVKIDLDALTKKVMLSGPSGWGSVKIELTQSGSLGTGNRTIELREIDVCENGQAKKRRFLCSDAYTP